MRQLGGRGERREDLGIAVVGGVMHHLGGGRILGQ